MGLFSFFRKKRTDEESKDASDKLGLSAVSASKKKGSGP